ncbi:uncharacterized protein KY384_004932 [Bacidia gigantensis]|uniref:uncharacterized protein n=1 Tax=Bacidia gigantensis TaxID=2732470 RepID=UPI001D038ECA|nr:uncharacterized protein KY384_004932 [Bacidia gigantensis]KAG8530430.1 hypothetical protein KY384_004932 [Bacidia gigantensis]
MSSESNSDDPYFEDRLKVAVTLMPTEAGTHFAGQCKAPAAFLERGGLEHKLNDADLWGGSYGSQTAYGIFSDTETEEAISWKPSPKIEGVRNLSNALKVMQEIKAKLATSFGLIYVDGDVDLTLPSQTSTEGSSGILDSMVMTHLTRRRGGLESMEQFNNPKGSPLVNPENIVLFGFDPLQPATEHWVYLLENGFKCFSRPTVEKDPIECARQAVSWLEERVDVILLHFDVDVIDSGLFPLANYPHYAGLDFDTAMDAVTVFIESPKVLSMVITEVNPNNDSLGMMITQLVDRLVTALRAKREAPRRTESVRRVDRGSTLSADDRLYLS